MTEPLDVQTRMQETWAGVYPVFWNKPCRLRFVLHQASLYAFQFRELENR